MRYEILNDGAVVNTIEADAAFMYATFPDGSYREAHLPPEPVLPVVPQVVTIRQARLALLAAGLLDDICAAVTAAGRAAQIEWEYATEVRRDHPLIGAMQASRGLTDDELDALFAAASGM